MKLILNDSTLEITSRDRENRHKVQMDGWSITSGNQWTSNYPLCKSFFIDVKVGDNVVITPKTGKRILIAFTANETPEHGTNVVFANGASSRVRQDTAYTASVIENCYLWVQEEYNTGSTSEDFEPESIVINGLTLDENGYL